jgi:predicted transposase/invertase (TIGR01784 family)
MVIVNPRIDLIFKKLFGIEENKGLLISLLNSIVSEEDQVDYTEILNPYNEKNFRNDKLSILDIKARNKASRGSLQERTKVFRAGC